MNRDDILTLVVGYMTDANEELRAADVNPARSMVDHGLTSLDIVEVVTRAMRQLTVTIPRPELRKMRNINDLVDALHRTVAARKP